MVLWQITVYLVLLGFTVGLTVAFGPVGFIIGILLCWAQSASFRRREQNKQHKELVAELRSRKG